MSNISDFLMKRRRTRYGTHLALSFVCFVLAIPVLYALLVASFTFLESFSSVEEQFPPGSAFFGNVGELFTDNHFDRYIWNTVVVAAVVVIGKTAFSMLAGLAFVYFRFPGKWFLFFFALLTLLLPTEIILLPLFNLVADLEWGANNPRLALTVPFLASAAGAFLFRQHFSNIPREMADAAQMDGANPLRFLWSVLLPMSWNVIVAHAVLQFIAMWHLYLWPIIVLQSEDDQLVQQGVRAAASFGTQPDFRMAMTAGVVASLPPLIVFILLQKQFMSGFSLTRDK